MGKIFDDYEKDRAEKEKLIEELRKEISSFKSEHEQLKSDVGNQEQYTRRNFSSFLVFPKNKGKVQIVLL